jgi:hypothetical protein
LEQCVIKSPMFSGEFGGLPGHGDDHEHRVEHGDCQCGGAHPLRDGTHPLHQSNLSHPSSRYNMNIILNIVMASVVVPILSEMALTLCINPIYLTLPAGIALTSC